jgi:hypothetical protein
MRGISWLADELLASEEGLCSMELSAIVHLFGTINEYVVMTILIPKSSDTFPEAIWYSAFVWYNKRTRGDDNSGSKVVE